MNDADTLGAITMLLCLVGSMFFSGSETAITSFSERRARMLMEGGGPGAKVIASWVHHPVRVLSTILVGNNLTNTLMGAVATALAIRHLSSSEWGEYAVPVAVFVTTALLLVFGEIMPKAVGRIYAGRLVVPVLIVLNLLGRILFPVTWILTKLTNLMIAPALRGDDASLFRQVTRDEIDYLVKVGKQEGSIPEDQAALLQGIFRFEDKIVRDIMVPRDRVTAIDLEWELSRVVAETTKSGHSRLPVYSGDLDQIRGVLHIKQLVGVRSEDREALRRLIRAPLFVSESLLIQDLLRQFKQRRLHLAIVVDDGGHTVGVVTLEDVLEQIVGQIFDETDRPSGQAIVAEVGVYHLEGQAPLIQVEELLDVEFDEYDGVDSVGDLITRLAGQIPLVGSVVVCESVRFKVLAADVKHVSRVSAERIDQEDD